MRSNIKQLRKQRNISQKMLGEEIMINVSLTTVKISPDSLNYILSI